MSNRPDSLTFLAIAALTVLTTFPSALRGRDGAVVASAIRSAVEADWDRQERRLGRSSSSPEAVRARILAAERLLADLSHRNDAPELERERTALADLQLRAAGIGASTDLEHIDLYRDIRWLTRGMALENPLIADKSIIFMKRKRFICQMLHEYLGYYYDYEDIAGGGIYLLKEPGRSFAHQDLTGNRLGRGNYTTLALSYDARTIYFAFAERAAQKPDFYSEQRKCFHIYAMDADGGNIRQVTRGADDDFDPCPLPDGGLAFMSSARGGFTRCNNPWEPLPAHTLHRLDPTLRHRRILSFHETSEWHPSVLHDGRIVYIRWDYVDRSAANFHGLWIANPDGSAPMGLFGNYTMNINACYQPKAIPN
ncbi:MAG TPA: hypothetical protein ENI81_11470, partial [Phycisphaerales bacterium]|nr:hypothetical protein [Phycisphaerales bacterium]